MLLGVLLHYAMINMQLATWQAPPSQYPTLVTKKDKNEQVGRDQDVVSVDATNRKH